ncbi:MAG: FapA family protein [Treponema sp.]|jgi:uncharacterized protein (DUF342 family)|nr:FapA family protein [Treponema sp.]
MVKFPELQKIMKQQLEADKEIRAAETSGATLDEALNEAATLLNLSVSHLDYEIIERGFPGFLGAAKKKWEIRAYKRLTDEKQTKARTKMDNQTETVTAQIENKDGEFFVHLFDDGVKLKVIPPSGTGKPVDLNEVRQAIKMRNISDILEDALALTVQEAKGVYVHVGNFERKMTNDSMVQVMVTEQDMKALITVIPPGPFGCDPSPNIIKAVLRANRVVFGFDEKAINDFVDRPSYKMPVVVAEGRKPVNGRDAYIHYYFEVDSSKPRIEKKSDGQIDFKDKNIVQNVVKDQPLAKKIPAEDGVEGKTVLGSYIPTTNGRNIELQLGSNVHLDTDRETVLADINGQVMIVNGKISVEPILTLPGNVDIKTGNIIFLGTVIVNGNVEDGFTVKAEGNVEVRGTIGKAEVEADGDIRAYKGITGRNGGKIKAGKNVYASFVENAIINAGDSVIVSDGIINSEVVAYRRIICQGKRASIVGGHLKATEEISAKVIGSAISGTETICEAGFDPKLKAELDELLEKKIALDKELNEIKLNLDTLAKLKKLMDELPEDKTATMIELLTKRKHLLDESAQLTESITQKQNEMDEAAGQARISASERMLPGVKLILRDKVEKIQTEYKKITFILENGVIRPQRYEENKEAMAQVAASLSGTPVDSIRILASPGA